MKTQQCPDWSIQDDVENMAHAIELFIIAMEKPYAGQTIKNSRAYTDLRHSVEYYRRKHREDNV